MGVVAKKKSADALWCPVTKSRYVTALHALVVNHRPRDWSLDGRFALADDLYALAASESNPGPEAITMAVDRVAKLADDLRACETFPPLRVLVALAECVQDEAIEVSD